MRRRRVNTRRPAVMLSSDGHEGDEAASIAAQVRAEMEDEEDEDDYYVEENAATKEKLDNIQTRLQVTNIACANMVSASCCHICRLDHILNRHFEMSRI
eukprot:COSAG02_NODE_54566_length_295_cov_1.000000_1_plen_98_part_11